jgi:hypothetical protein
MRRALMALSRRANPDPAAGPANDGEVIGYVPSRELMQAMTPSASQN